MCDYLKSASARGHPSVSSRAVLAVVETEDIVVHVEVLRVGRSRHEQEHLAELERVGLALNLKRKKRNEQQPQRLDVSSSSLRLQLQLSASPSRPDAFPLLLTLRSPVTKTRIPAADSAQSTDLTACWMDLNGSPTNFWTIAWGPRKASPSNVSREAGC